MLPVHPRAASLEGQPEVTGGRNWERWQAGETTCKAAALVVWQEADSPEDRCEVAGGRNLRQGLARGTVIARIRGHSFI